MGLHYAWLGYPEKAKAHIQSALRISENYDSQLFTNDAFWFSAWTSLELQDWESARKYTNAALEISVDQNYFLLEAFLLMIKGRILSHDGKHLEAVEIIQRGLELFHGTGFITNGTFGLQALAKAYKAKGMVKEGLEVVQRSEEFEQQTGEARQKASLQKIKGDLYLQDGNPTAAEEAYLNAIAVAREQHAKLLELEAVKGLARLWHKQGRTEDALEQLSEIYDWFTEGFETPVLVEAKELLGELRGNSRP